MCMDGLKNHKMKKKLIKIKGVEVKYSPCFYWILLGFYKWLLVPVSSVQELLIHDF